jgi:hypothetical protein
VTEEFPLAGYNQGAQPHPLFDQTGPSPASVPSPVSSMGSPDERPGWQQETPPLDELGNVTDPAWAHGPPHLVDTRSLRISGRDQAGKMWNAGIWGGSHPQQGEGSNIHPLDPEMRRTGDKMLRNLEYNSGDMIAGLRVLQARLNSFYRR